jgi:chromate transporter
MSTKSLNIKDLARRATMTLLLALVTTATAWAQNSPTVRVEALWQFSVSVALFIATFIGTKVYKVNPIHMIAMAGFAGLLLLD